VPNAFTRRSLLIGATGVVGAAGAYAVVSRLTDGDSSGLGSAVLPDSDAVRRTEAARRVSGGRLVTARLTPRPTTLDLGGPTVETWAYGDSLPGPLLTARAGDRLQIDVANDLPEETSVHWHGIALRNDMDGVPGVTQTAIASGSKFRYEFTVPDPGTFFYHPHVGVQLDRGLYGVLIVDDPAEPGRYDAEWVVVLDDWLDGTGRTPDQVLASLTGGMGLGGMGGMGMAGARSPILGDAGDVRYPYYLVNGRVPTSPDVFTARPQQRIRLRIVNAASDTAFRVALAGHRLTVTHTDGFPVQAQAADALLIGMGERVDAEVAVGDGVFPLVAVAEGKGRLARGLLRTSSGRTPAASVQPDELAGDLLLSTDLRAADDVRLVSRVVERAHDLILGGSMMPFRWTINGQRYPDTAPLPVVEGERVRLRFVNHGMMFHPMHVHGHTFALVDGGARKDTVIVGPMRLVEVDLDANNPGQWMTHCHNAYHAERGMMVDLSYRA
jgi:multicopper oxidase